MSRGYLDLQRISVCLGVFEGRPVRESRFPPTWSSVGNWPLFRWRSDEPVIWGALRQGSCAYVGQRRRRGGRVPFARCARKDKGLVDAIAGGAA